MNEKVQLKHPQGKKPISMSKEKYNLLKPAVLKYLRTKGEATFSEISSAIEKDLKTKGQTFQGSLPWHLEWVKLDLEARKVIRRVPNSSPQEYMIVP
jgi:hypothetical protein